MVKNPDLARQMRLLRKSNGYTQQQVADLLNIDRTTYTAYETNRNTPDVMLLEAFARIFSVRVDFLLHIDPTADSVLCDTETKYGQKQTDSLLSQLSSEERALIAGFRLASEPDKQKILNLAEQCNPCKTDA